MLTKQTIRFFVLRTDEESGEFDYLECDESEFEEAEGEIDYERHTVFENGVAQICLYKDNEYRG